MHNVREYHRPTDLEEAVRLLQRKGVRTAILAGGVGLVGEGNAEIEALVDLDAVGLDFIETQNSTLHLGAMVRLQTLVDKASEIADGLLAETARRTASLHIRNAATLGGLIASGDVNAPLSVALAALKARVKIYGEAGEMPFWSELSGSARLDGLRGRLVTALTINLPSGKIGTGYDQVGRTSADRPIVSACAVVLETTTGVECTVAIGGLVLEPELFSQNINKDMLESAPQLFSEEIARQRSPGTTFQSDFLGSAEYRRSVAPALARRAVQMALEKFATSNKG